MSQDMRKRLNILVMVGFFLVIWFVTMRGEKGIELKIEENGLTISVTSGEALYVDYEKIRNLSFVQDFERGERVSGPEKRGISAGTWKNEQYEEYTLFAYDKIPSVIILETDGGVIALNYESKNTTEEFYATLKDYLNNR